MDNKTKALIVIGSVLIVGYGIEVLAKLQNNKLVLKTQVELEKIELQKQKLQKSTEEQ